VIQREWARLGAGAQRLAARRPLAAAGAAATLLVGVGLITAAFLMAGSAKPGPARSPAATESPARQSPLLADTFARTATGDPPAGEWTVDAGSWVVEADPDGTHFLRSGTAGLSLIFAGSSDWSDITVQADVRAGAGMTFAGVAARYVDSENHYFCRLQSDRYVLGRTISGERATLQQGLLTVQAGTWYTMALRASGSRLSCDILGFAPLVAGDSTFPDGAVGLVASGEGDFRAVEVRRG
jgi:hypothetical protein